MTAATTARPRGNALGRFLRLITPLRVPLLFAVILAAWPLVLPLAWLATVAGFVVLVVRHQCSKGAQPAGGRLPAARARSGAAMVAAARAAAPTRRQPANAIARTAGRLPRR
jgi:hypothetical protein